MTLLTLIPARPARGTRAKIARAAVAGALMAGLFLSGGALAQSAARPSGAGSKSDSFCASYGPGFQRVPGSDSCVKTGAAVRTDAYSGNGVSNAPNQFNNSTSSTLPATGTTPTDPWQTAR